MPNQHQDDKAQVHPLIYPVNPAERTTVKIFAVNQKLICPAANPEDFSEVDYAECNPKGSGRCPERSPFHCPILSDECVPAKQFLDSLGSDRAKIFALFKLLDIGKGILSNREKFRKLIDIRYKGMEFFEFKNHQIRIGCFWQPGYNLFLTHGFKKKRDDWPSGEIKTLKNIYDDFLRISEQNSTMN